MKRKIIVVTGTRAEYGLLKPILRSIQRQPYLDLKLVVTGMHLSKLHGCTINEIRSDGFKINHIVRVGHTKDTPAAMAHSVSVILQGCISVFNRQKPHVLLVLGDRTEAFAAAIAASYMNIFIAHIHGGDKTRAGPDECARHTITKLAHIHFAATSNSAARIAKMGEEKKRIFAVGAPGLDIIRETPLLKKDELISKLKLGIAVDEKYIVFIQHPVTTQYKFTRVFIRESLQALRKAQVPIFCIYPNNDAGSQIIIKEINKFATVHPHFKIFKTLPRVDYLSLLKHATLLVGNSSSGIIESASLKLPVINIGIRQAGRECSSNVVNVNPRCVYIWRTIQRILNDSQYINRLKNCRNVYGNGKSGDKIARILARIKLTPYLLQKRLTY